MASGTVLCAQLCAHRNTFGLTAILTEDLKLQFIPLATV